MFDDLLEANATYSSSFRDPGVPGVAAKGLAVVTCIDSRIDPLAMLGLVPGDAKILRNAGARVTDDALRSLVLAANRLGVERIAVVQHTDCAMSKSDDDQIRSELGAKYGVDASGWEFRAFDDQEATARADIERIRSCELLPAGIEVAGFLYDVHTGSLEPLV